ncbi:MAG: 16S rRNA (cytosine(1402)-N(4))-methyltransferase RsmH [Desulfovibrionaceae bacterium]|nr:16S rRNA (cytosine(1402)-N(4))-methyltransferase RsmH [Desulfovibrionaceae bacterium]
MDPAVRPAHEPVLLPEVVGWLRPRPGGRYLDATVGLGGHSLGLLEAAQGGIEILGLDRDASALAKAEERLAGYAGRVHLVHSAFSGFARALADLGWTEVDGAMLDLGVSSLQLDDPARGFSFRTDGPLDMRMDLQGGLAPARNLVNRAGLEVLKRIIRDYGEEPLAGRIARAIVRERQKGEIRGTLALAEIVAGAYPAKRRRQARLHPATRTFMALRIAVNRELEELGEFLADIADFLSPGARLAVISFHSLEDRLVKRAFRDLARGCVCPPGQAQCACASGPGLNILTKRPQVPGEDEMQRNPRSRSAKLRVAEKPAPAAEER